MSTLDPVLAFALGVGVTLVLGYLWLRLRWSRPRGAAPPPGSLVEPESSAPDSPTSPTGPSNLPTPEPSRDASGPSVPELRLSERVILHLDRYDGSKLQELASFMLCQQGMVEKLGARQSALTKILQRLAAAGALVETTEHVQGGSRRRKVYRLTTLGRLLAKDLRRRGSDTAGRASAR